MTDYLCIATWLSSVTLGGWILYALPSNPDNDCTELGRSVCYVAATAVLISALLTSAHMIARFVA